MAVFPTSEMQATVAAAEDALSRWEQRGPGYRPQMMEIGERAVHELGELIVLVGAYRDWVDEQVRAYGRRRTKTSRQP